MKFSWIIIVAASILLCRCNGGLMLPPEVQPGIAGSLIVQSAWPPQDSVQTLWIFASQIYPLDSSKVVSGILSNQILIYPSIDKSLPYNVSALTYNFPLPPGTYYYIGVLQRFGSNLVDPRSYRVVGVYHDSVNPLVPLTVQVRAEEIVSGVNITVDFYNLPPQPF